MKKKLLKKLEQVPIKIPKQLPKEGFIGQIPKKNPLNACPIHFDEIPNSVEFPKQKKSICETAFCNSIVIVS